MGVKIFSKSTVPKYIYKFCVGSPIRVNPVASFLLVPKEKEIKDVLARKDLKLNLIGVVDESLIYLSNDIEKVKKSNERWQCLYFVVKSKKEFLCNKEETIHHIISMEESQQYEMCLQLIIIICGLGDIGFDNLHTQKKKNNLFL